MLHYIIVNWKDGNKEELTLRARKLYSEATSIKGISAVEIKENVTPRDNRYDLMIVLTMQKESLPVWDNRELHLKWKADFGKYIDKKCIFDCE